MKKRSLKPIILSALLASTFAATTVGTTFALFTDRADTKIEVTAGIVDLAIEYANLKAYSLDENDNAELVEVSGGKFATNGTYELNAQTGTVKLNKMVPGDKVEFDIKLTNKSNVKTKYRFAMSKTGTLAPYLHASFGAATLQWKALDAVEDITTGKLIETAHVVIDFPNTGSEITVREEGYDNSAQGLSATYVLGYEMVQGNAHVVDTAPAIDPVTVSEAPEADPEQEGVYTFDIMSPDALVGVSGIAKDENDVTLKVTSAEEGNFTIEGATTANYNIEVENRKEGKAVTVKLYVGEGYETVYVFHADETTPLAGTSYDAATGYVTFTTTAFSPFHFAGVKEAMKFVKTEQELRAALEVGGKIHLANDIIASSVNGTGTPLAVVKDTAIYGHNFTITNRATRAMWIDEANVSLELHDVSILGDKVEDSTYPRGLQLNEPGAKVLLDGTSISEVSHYAINAISAATNAEITIKNSSVASGWAALNIWGANSVINVENSRLIGTNDKAYNADGWNNFATIVINGDSANTRVNLKNTIVEANVVEDTQGNKNTQWALSLRAANTIFSFNDVTFKKDGEVLDFAENWYPTLTSFGSTEAIQTNKIYLDGELFYSAE